MLISVSLEIGGYRRTLSTRQNWESAIRVGDLTPDQIVEADLGTGRPTKVRAGDVAELAQYFPPPRAADPEADTEAASSGDASMIETEDNEESRPEIGVFPPPGADSRRSRGQITPLLVKERSSTRRDSGSAERATFGVGPGAAIVLAAAIISAGLYLSRSQPPRHSNEQPPARPAEKSTTPGLRLPGQTPAPPPAGPTQPPVAPPQSAAPSAPAPTKPPSQAKPPPDEPPAGEDSKRRKAPAPLPGERAPPPTPIPPPRPRDLVPAMSIPGRDDVPPGEDAIVPTTADAITVRVCDRTDYALRLAAVYTPRSAPHSFRSVGYWRVEAHACRDLFQTVNVKFYLHGEKIEDGAVMPTSQPGSLRQVCRIRNAPYSQLVPPNSPICPAGLESDEFTYIASSVRSGPTVYYYYE